jgi:hypothetical protein
MHCYFYIEYLSFNGLKSVATKTAVPKGLDNVLSASKTSWLLDGLITEKVQP